MTKEELRKGPRDLTHVVLNDLKDWNFSLLLAFKPMKSEVDINPVIDKALQLGIPVAYALKNPYAFDFADGTTVDIRTIKVKTLMLVPGLLFTSDGRRLGRGGGFYDRTISVVADCVTVCGVCKASQLVKDIPVLAHDMKVDKIIQVPLDAAPVYINCKTSV